MSEVRSWSVPTQQMSGQPTVATTDKLNPLILIRSKTPVHLVMTDQSAPSTVSVPTLPSSQFSRFLALHSRLGVCSNPTVSWWTSPKRFSKRVTYVIKLSKAYKASSNVLKEIVKLT